MRVEMATRSGHVGRPNEDFVGAASGLVVLLDGAGIPDTEEICHHGVAWYSHTLGATLLARLSLGAGTSQATALTTALTTALADSIEQVAAQHRHSCDLANPSSPQATVAMVRFDGDRADYLVLADTFVVLGPLTGEPEVVTDPREVSVRRECTAPLDGLRPGTPDYERTRPSVVDAFRARRNQPGGYWIAKDDARAAAEAVVGGVSLRELDSATLLSNGASRIVDPYQLATWPAVLELLRTGGPDALLGRIRRAESDAGAAGSLPGFQSPDDATVAHCALSR
jgi:Protein phosphatase 2C